MIPSTTAIVPPINVFIKNVPPLTCIDFIHQLVLIVKYPLSLQLDMPGHAVWIHLYLDTITTFVTQAKNNQETKWRMFLWEKVIHPIIFLITN